MTSHGEVVSLEAMSDTGEAEPGRKRWKRFVPALILLAVAVGAILVVVRWPATTPAMRGEAIAGRLACFTCHGPGAIRASPNLGAGDEEIPAWDQSNHLMYIKQEADIAAWILDGRAEGGQSEPWVPAKNGALIPMPAYRGQLGDGELADLIAYYKAVAWYDPAIPEAAAKGRKLAEKMGCFSCHGAAGRGGSPNPGSFKGYIPPWDGADFDELVTDDQELKDWIMTGTIPRFEKNPLARWFLERQTVKMPAYKDALSAPELETIMTYIRYLRGRPLEAAPTAP